MPFSIFDISSHLHYSIDIIILIFSVEYRFVVGFYFRQIIWAFCYWLGLILGIEFTKTVMSFFLILLKWTCQSSGISREGKITFEKRNFFRKVFRNAIAHGPFSLGRGGGLAAPPSQLPTLLLFHQNQNQDRNSLFRR